MNRPPVGKLIPTIVAAAAILAIVLWVWSGDAEDIVRRVEADSPSAAPEATYVPAVPLPGVLVTGEGVTADVPGVWPRFRGAGYSNISTEDVSLIRTFPAASGPEQLWSIDLGEGYAGAAVLAGRVYVLDYDQVNKADALRCFSLADGREIWRRWYSVLIKRQHGMSRTIPAVTEKFVLTMGPKCHVLCCDAVSGQARWSLDLVREYGTTVPPWYAGQCPLIDTGRAILAPAGPEALMLAVDCETGEVVWTTPNPHGWKMSHSSIIPMKFAGRRMYVYCPVGGVVGVSAETGRILWETDAWRISMATVPSPVDLGDGRIFLTGAYGAGSMMLQLQDDGDELSVDILYELAPKEFGAEQQTPVFYKGFLFGVRIDGQLACLDPRQGKVLWTSGASERFGLGPYMIADGMILVMNDHGVLTLVEADPDAYRPIARAQALSGHDSWAPMALAGGRLIVRDLTKMVCLDMRR